MHPTSDLRPSLPVAFAGHVCLLMLCGGIVSGDPWSPLTLVFSCFPPAAAAEPSLPGGWSKVSVHDKGVKDAAAFAIKARRRAMKAAGEGDALELVRVSRARQQVVAGMNYHLALEVKAGDVTKAIDAEVWAQPWLPEEDRHKLTSWKVREDAEPEPDTAAKPKPAPKPAE